VLLQPQLQVAEQRASGVQRQLAPQLQAVPHAQTPRVVGRSAVSATFTSAAHIHLPSVVIGILHYRREST
jgi:hypothetical protein